METNFIRRRIRRGLGLLAALSPLWLLALVLTRAAPAQAGSVVVGDGQNPASCNMFSLGAAMNDNTDADIAFSCGGPATVVITQAGGLVVLPGQHFNLYGADAITLSGADSSRLFWVQSGGALTLSHILLTHGYAASGGDYPTQGGAVLNEGAYLALDHATIRDSRAAFAAGAIEDSGGTTVVRDSLIENNQADYGGGIDSLGALTLLTTTLRANHAITGGGLDLGGVVTIGFSQLISNSADVTGGGLRVAASAQVQVDDSLFSQNSQGAGPVPPGTPGGGAIENEGTLTLTNSLVSHNSAVPVGGGLLNLGLGRVNLIADILSGNSTTDAGGGVYNAAGDPVRHTITLFVSRSTFSGNTAVNSGHPIVSSGGGLVNVNSALAYIVGSTFSGNSAYFGGALLNDTPATATLIDDTLSGNAATIGGALYNRSHLTAQNVTVSNNGAAIGGAVFMLGTADTALTNTVLAYSARGGNCSGTVTASKDSLSSDDTCGLGGPVKGLNPNGLDPLLTALANFGGLTQVHMLKLGSPAIDGVAGNDAPAFDQRDAPRPAFAGYDIGAVERQPTDTGLAPWLWLPTVRR